MMLLRQFAHGIDRTLPTFTTDQHFGHHDRNTDKGDTEQIQQHEGTATVFTGDVGKLPDVAKTDGRTGGRQHEQPAARPHTVPRFATFGHEHPPNAHDRLPLAAHSGVPL